MMKPLWLLLLLCLTFGQQPRSSAGARPPARSEIQNVEFCELLGDPGSYDQKLVRTRAIFRYGGEDTSELYCPDCSGVGWGWVIPVFGDSYESCTKREVVKKLSRQEHTSGTVRVTIVGKFLGGQKGERSFQFQIQCVEQAEYITKDYHSPETLPAKIRERVRCK